MTKLQDTAKIKSNISIDSNSVVLNKQLISNPVVNALKTYNDDFIVIKQKYAKKGDNSEQNLFLHKYTFEPWSDIISVKNSNYKTYINEKPVFYTLEKDSSKILKPFDVEKSTIHLNQYNSFTNNFILLLLFASFTLLAWVKISFEKYLNQLLRSAILYSEAARMYFDHNTIINRFYLIMNIIFVNSGGLFIYYLIKYIQPAFLEGHPVILLSGCFVLISAIFFYRFIITKTFGFILFQSKTFNEYLHSNYSYFKVLGLFLLPLVLIKSFMFEKYEIELLTIGILLIFILYIISIFRATKIILQKGILIFYWILYLCTVEFLPILLLYKYLRSFV